MDTLIRSLVISALGISVVFLTLVALQGFLHLMNLVMGHKPKSNQENIQDSGPVQQGIPPQHVAAIAAAVAMLDEGYKIRAIHPASNSNWEQSRYLDFSASDV